MKIKTRFSKGDIAIYTGPRVVYRGNFVIEQGGKCEVTGVSFSSSADPAKQVTYAIKSVATGRTQLVYDHQLKENV